MNVTEILLLFNVMIIILDLSANRSASINYYLFLSCVYQVFEKDFGNDERLFLLV